MVLRVLSALCRPLPSVFLGVVVWAAVARGQQDNPAFTGRIIGLDLLSSHYFSMYQFWSRGGYSDYAAKEWEAMLKNMNSNPFIVRMGMQVLFGEHAQYHPHMTKECVLLKGLNPGDQFDAAGHAQAIIADSLSCPICNPPKRKPAAAINNMDRGIQQGLARIGKGPKPAITDDWPLEALRQTAEGQHWENEQIRKHGKTFVEGYWGKEVGPYVDGAKEAVATERKFAAAARAAGDSQRAEAYERIAQEMEDRHRLLKEHADDQTRKVAEGLLQSIPNGSGGRQAIGTGVEYDAPRRDKEKEMDAILDLLKGLNPPPAVRPTYDDLIEPGTAKKTYDDLIND